MKNVNNRKIKNTVQNTNNIQNKTQQQTLQYTITQRREILRWLADAPDNDVCAVMERINPTPYRKFLPPEEARLQALLAAADTVRSAGLLTDRKNSAHDLDKLDAAHDLRVAMLMKKSRKKSPTLEKVVLRAGLIKKLRAQRLSWRKAAEYLTRYADLKINHGYLRQCYLKLGLNFKQTTTPDHSRQGS